MINIKPKEFELVFRLLGMLINELDGWILDDKNGCRKTLILIVELS